MKLDNRTLALIAVGASVSANCQPCLERNVSTARKCGAEDREITEAIEIGKRVRQGAASKMDEFAICFTEAGFSKGIEGDDGCECASQRLSVGGSHE